MNIIQSRRTQIRDYLLLVVGAYIMAFAIVKFWAPHDLVTGGVSGLSIIIYHYTEIMGRAVPLGASNFILNVPLLVLGWRTMGKTFIARTAFTTVLVSVAMYTVRMLPDIPSDVLLGSVFGGIFCGFGIGLIVRAMSSTGGTVLLASILHNGFLRHISVGKLLFGCDFIVIVVGLFVFGPESAMYAVIGVFVSTKVTDAVLEGFSFSKAAYIISDKSAEISDEIFIRINRGVTEISARGMYTKEPRGMLMCVVSGRELVQLKQLVYDMDKGAFIIVADVREVLGEGFSPHNTPA